MAVRIPDLLAAVPYYGTQPTAEETAKIEASLLIHYAELDQRVNSGWEDYKKALDKNNIDYKMYMYDGVNHGFHNNSTPRFDKDAADLSWKRTMEFFDKHLK
jgi:carboxymethylenebutenolidase